LRQLLFVFNLLKHQQKRNPYMEKIVFISGKRTAFGAFGGGLKDVSGTDLTVAAGNATLQAAGAKPEDVNHVIIGNVVQSGADAAYLARHTGLKMGIPVGVGAYIVNRLCGSGFQSWVDAAQMIMTGNAQCANSLRGSQSSL
jgi:acetyl-CoA acyltransferase 2